MQAINFSLRFLVFAAVLTFFLVNFVGAGFPRPMGAKTAPLQENLLANPNNPENYRLLAAEFLKNHDFTAASYFNNLGLSLFPTSLALLKQQDEIYIKLHEKKYMRDDIVYWKKVVGKYSDYRDGYAQLAYLHLKLGQEKEAKKYLEVVKKINPNWEMLQGVKL